MLERGGCTATAAAISGGPAPKGFPASAPAAAPPDGTTRSAGRPSAGSAGPNGGSGRWMSLARAAGTAYSNPPTRRCSAAAAATTNGAPAPIPGPQGARSAAAPDGMPRVRSGTPVAYAATYGREAASVLLDAPRARAPCGTVRSTARSAGSAGTDGSSRTEGPPPMSKDAPPADPSAGWSLRSSTSAPPAGSATRATEPSPASVRDAAAAPDSAAGYAASAAWAGARWRVPIPAPDAGAANPPTTAASSSGATGCSP